ncbi:MAG: Gfo/Idh/MocA family oxidoreductase [Oceanicaulis sp.]
MSVKVAVVGCGHWGKNHVRNFAELGALAAVVDPNAELAATFAEQYGVEALSYDAAVANASIDAVVIAAPAELHCKLAVQAFEAGKHVFVEKPIALTMEDGRAMREAADKAGKVLMVGHLLQYHPAFVALRELVRSGGLGTLRYAYSHRCSLGKFRTEENALWSFAPHDVSMLLALFGAAPDSVSGTGGAFVTEGVEDECRLDMTFPGGGRGHVFASWLHPFKEHRLVVVGSEAMAVFEDSEPEPAKKLRLYRHQIDTSGPVPVPSKAEAEPIAYDTGAEPLRSECAHFLGACAGEHPALTDANEALDVLEVLLKGAN